VGSPRAPKVVGSPRAPKVVLNNTLGLSFFHGLYQAYYVLLHHVATVSHRRLPPPPAISALSDEATFILWSCFVRNWRFCTCIEFSSSGHLLHWSLLLCCRLKSNWRLFITCIEYWSSGRLVHWSLLFFDNKEELEIVHHLHRILERRLPGALVPSPFW